MASCSRGLASGWLRRGLLHHRARARQLAPQAPRCYAGSSSPASASEEAPAGVTAASVSKAFEYCESSVRRYDYDHYLCSLYLPRELRPVAIATRAFNVETAQVADVTRHESLAVMRLQWWREAVDDIFKGKAVDHPVARLLAAVYGPKSSRTAKRWLQRIIDAREEDLRVRAQPATLADVEAYAERTMSSLLYLTLHAGGVSDAAADHAASHLGKAQGIVRLLLGTKHHSMYRRVYLPAAVTNAHGVSQEELFQLRDSDALREVFLSVAAAAKAHHEHAVRLGAQLQGDKAALVRRVLLPSVPCRNRLAAIERLNFDVLHQFDKMDAAGRGQLQTQLALLYHRLMGTF
mmetsp:Transcript_876/g.3201  ORF Transcript_876/g.3201 Transcript_876/m.3201 type:complete len:349 (-) Transcript_876:267-1313(-)